MKKRVFLLATVAMMTATAVNAQTIVGETPYMSPQRSIPAEFTSDNHTKAWVENNGTISIYRNDLTVVHQMTPPQGWTQQWRESDFDAQGADGTAKGLAITQTLFNNDEQYEFIVENNGNFSIVSENGTTLWSITASSTYLIKWDNQYFIFARGGDDIDYTYTWYHIDRPTQSITRVEGDMPINVFPSVADRSQTITVELGEGNNATEIQVVNAVGQVVKTVPVQPGQREVQLRASDLQSGLHIVGARSQDAQGACKIIVK